MAETHYLSREGEFEKAVRRGIFHVKSRELQDAAAAIRDYQKRQSAENLQRASKLLRKWRVTHTREFDERGRELEQDLRAELQEEFRKHQLDYEEPTSQPGLFSSELWQRRYVPLEPRPPQLVQCRTFEHAKDVTRALAEPFQIAPASRARSSAQHLPVALRREAAEVLGRSPEREAWVVQLVAKGSAQLRFDAHSKSFAAAHLLSASKGQRGELVIERFRRNIDYTLELVGFHSAAVLKRSLRGGADWRFCPTPTLSSQGLQRKTRAMRWFEKSGYQKLSQAALLKLRDDPVARDWVFPSKWKKLRRAAGPPVPMAPAVPFAGLALFLLYYPIAVAHTDWEAPKDHVATKFQARIRLWEVLPD